MKKPELILNLTEAYTTVLTRVASVPEENFYIQKNGKWSVAENLAHLTLSAKLFNRALEAPKLGLLFRFGINLSDFRDESWLDETYKKASFPDRTGFEPRMSEKTTKEFELEQFETKHLQLIENLKNWKEWQLDRLQLPHLIFKKLSIREYLIFLAYHIRHHERAIIASISPD